MTIIATSKRRGRRRPEKVRLAPFKILSLLEHGEYPWLRPDSEGFLTLELGPMAKDMRVSRERLANCLEWLQFYDYIEELELGSRTGRVRLAVPPNLRSQLDAERKAYLEVIKKQESIRAILVEVPSEDYEGREWQEEDEA